MSEGRLVGLSNLVRKEPAVLDERPDKVYLIMKLELENILTSYKWNRKKFR